jgi:hypothetical protein
MPKIARWTSPDGSPCMSNTRWLEVTIVRVERPHATNKERDPRIRWCVWIGDPEADRAQIALGSLLRVGQEHGSHCDTQALLWEPARLRTPEPCERWSHRGAMVPNYLVLARDLVQAALRPWERTQRQPTPQQVRRGIGTWWPRLGTPARPPHPRGTSTGRSTGATVKKAQRLAVIRTTPNLPQRVPS